MFPKTFRAGAAAGLVVLFSLLLTGCGIYSSSTWSRPPGKATSQYLAEVPFFPQERHQCGPASLAMMLSWSGQEIKPQDLSAQVYTPGRKGSLQPALITAARRHQRVAYHVQGVPELMAELGAGHPVLVLQNLGLSWIPRWHYAVVVGIDFDEQVIILHSGTTAGKHVSFRVFENTWSRSNFWGLLVLPPTELPATATEQRYLEAVVGLERAGAWKAAAAAYQRALERWNTSLPAWMGLGNSSYAAGRLERAEQAFRRAAQLDPANGAPLNNLAQVLWEQGRKEEARQAARRAVALGGRFQEVYQATLREFEQQTF